MVWATCSSATSAASPTRRAWSSRSACARACRTASSARSCCCSSTTPCTRSGAARSAGDLPLGEDWCRAQGIDVVKTQRGGKLTYHGPGQLVGYPIMRVGDVPAFVATMEGAIVDALGEAGVTARPRSHEGRECTGVWAGDRKLASIGVHVSRGVSAHGFAVNVDQRPRPVHLGRRLRAAVGGDDLGRAGGLARGPGLLPQAHGVPLRAGVRPPPAADHAAAARDRGPAREPVGTLDA